MDTHKLKIKLVSLHIIGVNPSYLFGHVKIANKLIENAFSTYEEYSAACASQGISASDVVAKKYFASLKD